LARKYPAIISLLAVIAGIVLADNLDIASWIYLLAALSSLPLLIAFYSGRKLLKAGVAGLVMLLLLSAFNYAFRLKTFPPGHIAHFLDGEQVMTIYGTVDAWPTLGENRTNVFLTVDSLACDGPPQRSLGRLLLRINNETTAINYGDRIFFKARLYSIRGGRNLTGHSYRRYLNLKGVFGTCYLLQSYSIQIDPVGRGHFFTLIGHVRSFILEAFDKSLSHEASAMAAGFLIGYTRDISPNIYGLFRDSGTLHLLAVSGSNVGLVVLMFVFLFRASPLKLRTRTILLLLIIIVFSFLAYNQPSVVRASVMASLVLIGRALPRKVELNNIIASAAMIILLFKPTDLYDIGFQLSFITAWGLIFFLPRLTELFRSRMTGWYYKYLIFPFLVCLVAQVVSLPVSAYYFQRLPMVSFLSNLVIVPLVSIIVIGELVLLLGYLILPHLGMMAGSLFDPLIQLTLSLLRIFGSGEMGLLFKYHLSGAIIFLYYIFLIILSSAIISKRARRMTILYILLTANVLVFNMSPDRGRQNKVSIFSVPGGTAALMQSGSPELILSDLGNREYLISEKIIVPFLENKKIEPTRLFVLSTDYQCLRETRYLLGLYDSLSAFLPYAARPAFVDVCRMGDRPGDTDRVTYFDKSQRDESQRDKSQRDKSQRDKSQRDKSLVSVDWMHYESALVGKSLIYKFENSFLVFAGIDCNLLRLNQLIHGSGKGCVLVKAQMDNIDLERLTANQDKKWSIIVCHKLTKRARRSIEKGYLSPAVLPEIYETSQLGAVELIAADGLIRYDK